MALNYNEYTTQEAVNRLVRRGSYDQGVKTVAFTGGTNNGKLLAAATLTTSLTGSNNDIVYTAATQGSAGNNISIEYRDTGTPGEALAVDVTGTAIVVTLERENVATAALTTALAGANNDLVFTAREEGTDGNSITVAYVDPSANDAELSIDVTGTDIVVNLATNGSGTITSTASQILTALNYDADAQDLIYTTLAAANTGAGVVTAMVATPLTGGADGDIVTTGDEIKTAIAGDVDANALVGTADAGGNDGSGVVTAMAATNLTGGSDGYVELFTVEEDGLVAVVGICSEDLAGATATVSVGLSGAATALIPQVTATDVDNGERLDRTGIIASTATPNATPFYPVKAGDVIRLTVGTANVTDGTIKFHLYTASFLGTTSTTTPAAGGGASTSTVTQVAAAATSTTLVAANSSRRAASITNDSTATLYLKLGSTASTTSYTVKLLTDDYYVVDGSLYTGIVTGIWSSATGNAYVTEV